MATPSLAQLIRQIKNLDPQMAQMPDAELEARWKSKYGETMPWDVQGTGLEKPRLPNPAAQVAGAATPLGMLAPFLSKYITTENAPTIGGLTGGAVGTAFGFPSVGAGAGAGLGEIVRQVGSGEEMDPSKIAQEALINSVLEKFGGAASNKLIKWGSDLYSKGSGLARNAFAQNFPTAVKEGITGGRAGLPIITSSQAQRAYRDVADIPRQLIEEADIRVGQPTLRMDTAVRRGTNPVIAEIGTGQPGNIGGAANPADEAARVADQAAEIIRQHSSPAQQIPYQTASGHFGITNIPPTPFEYTGLEMLTKKQGLGSRAAEALKAANADKFGAIDARTARGAMHGVREELEDYVQNTTGRNLAEANRQVQGRMGVAQSLNPSFRNPDELMRLGLSEPEALSAISNPGQSGGWLRNASEFGAGLGAGMLTGNPYVGAMAYGAAHAVNSPTAQRLMGAGLYRTGQATPNLMRFGRGATMNPEEDALTRALSGVQF